MVVILMGVTASGKTTVGSALSEHLRWAFADADDFHPPENISKMHAGIPLTDADRAPWLAALNVQIFNWLGTTDPAPTNAILACSALKQEYRERLLTGIAPSSARFVFLDGPPSVIQERLAQRTNHFMSPALLSSQFATLEIPPDALRVSIDQPVPAIVQQIVVGLHLAEDFEVSTHTQKHS